MLKFNHDKKKKYACHWKSVISSLLYLPSQEQDTHYILLLFSLSVYVSYEGWDRHYHYYLNESDRTSCNTSDNVCWDVQNWHYCFLCLTSHQSIIISIRLCDNIAWRNQRKISKLLRDCIINRNMMRKESCMRGTKENEKLKQKSINKPNRCLLHYRKNLMLWKRGRKKLIKKWKQKFV